LISHASIDEAMSDVRSVLDDSYGSSLCLCPNVYTVFSKGLHFGNWF